MFDIREILSRARKVVSSHAGTNPAEYHRVLKPLKAESIKTGITVYGCADATCILYTLDELPEEMAEREAWIETIRRFQNPETGLVEDGSYHYIHTTAFALAAEIFLSTN